MQSFFQLPLELMSMSDDEFWDNVSRLDEIGERIELSADGFAVTLTPGQNDGQKQLKIPFIRFKKTLPTSIS